jgi:hypothetical protein
MRNSQVAMWFGSVLAADEWNLPIRTIDNILRKQGKVCGSRPRGWWRRATPLPRSASGEALYGSDRAAALRTPR